jgi:pimeloyl-ACP methyl ester carboxylesterase
MRDVLVTTVNESYEAELEKMRVPAVLVWGSRDRDVPLTVAEQAVKVMSTHTELRVEDGCGHLVPLERPAALVDAVVSLL